MLTKENLSMGGSFVLTHAIYANDLIVAELLHHGIYLA